MTGGKEHYQSLRDLYRLSQHRRFRAKHRNNRWADILGFGPHGDYIIGWWDGQDKTTEFDPDDENWTRITTYV